MSIPENDETIFFQRLEERGEASVRADLLSAHFGARSALAQKWLYLKDEERAIIRDEQAVRSIIAAEKAATASERAAEGTLNAARWAKWAAMISLAAVLVSLVALLVSVLVNAT